MTVSALLPLRLTIVFPHGPKSNHARVVPSGLSPERPRSVRYAHGNQRWRTQRAHSARYPN